MKSSTMKKTQLFLVTLIITLTLLFCFAVSAIAATTPTPTPTVTPTPTRVVPRPTGWDEVSVYTNPVKAITATTATLTGNVRVWFPQYVTSVRVWFAYHETTGGTEYSVGVQTLTGIASASISTEITGLKPNTSYTYCVRCSNPPYTSQDSTFTTLSDGSISPTPTRRATPTPTPAKNYVVSYVIHSDWGNGATVGITITNNSAAAINGWTLAWTFPGNQTITDLWNGTYTQSGAAVSVKDAGYNASILANGGTTNLGFNLNYSGTNAKPASFTLNGTACKVQ
jgi:cellulase/cellobiase CelA1